MEREWVLEDENIYRNYCHVVGSKNAGQIEVAVVVVSTNHVVFLANRSPRLISLPTSAIFVSGTSGITAILKYRSVNTIVLVLFLFSISFIIIIPVNLCVLVTGFGSTCRWLQKTTNLQLNFTPNSTSKFCLKNRFETITITFSCQRFVFKIPFVINLTQPLWQLVL